MIKFLTWSFHFHDWDRWDIDKKEYRGDDMDIMMEDMCGDYKCRDCSKEK